ncbi:phage major tail tube protein [Cereibacter sphaeroides]|uniref:phage major tail tube protein n=1 Tax=Cereibacter sphaeroides TaxID=1063 RepID=UPI000F532A94|nr:phage major tail tube protein [Cereibacter sphaeroides]AZB63856.1 phage major tail tube protein [Cereibacter sphaeroides]AZB68222.1 phage major tail tube protein [Cereibacter sphaeroides]
MAARDILKNFAAFIDGRGYAGQATSVSPPDLSIMTEDFRAGGMDGPVALDMGQEALESSIVLSAYSADVLPLWGVGNGLSVPMTLRGALESYDGTVKPVEINQRGIITTIARGEWTPGQVAPLTITIRLDYYKETVGGVLMHEIDLVNMIRIVAGVDRLAAQRAALGI